MEYRNPTFSEFHTSMYFPEEDHGVFFHRSPQGILTTSFIEDQYVFFIEASKSFSSVRGPKAFFYGRKGDQKTKTSCSIILLQQNTRRYSSAEEQIVLSVSTEDQKVYTPKPNKTSAIDDSLILQKTRRSSPIKDQMTVFYERRDGLPLWKPRRPSSIEYPMVDRIPDGLFLQKTERSSSTKARWSASIEYPKIEHQKVFFYRRADGILL